MISAKEAKELATKYSSSEEKLAYINRAIKRACEKGERYLILDNYDIDFMRWFIQDEETNLAIVKDTMESLGYKVDYQLRALEKYQKDGIDYVMEKLTIIRIEW